MKLLLTLTVVTVLASCISTSKNMASRMLSQQSQNFTFPFWMTQFRSYEKNPVFAGTGQDTWDRTIRERGSIFIDDKGLWHLFYTGYNWNVTDRGPDQNFTKDALGVHIRRLGHATSVDGFDWSKQTVSAPLTTSPPDVWIEDMDIVQRNGRYFMFSEGDDDDMGHMLVSDDLQVWTDDQTADLALRRDFDAHTKRRNMIDLRSKDGSKAIVPPYGTVVNWIDDDGVLPDLGKRGSWYIFYEHKDLFINLAKAVQFDSRGTPKVWQNIQDTPVIPLGSAGSYDDFEVALDQVFRYDGRFYAYYHALSKYDQDHPLDPVKNTHNWTTCLAASDDLVHWQKFSGNPVVPNGETKAEKNKSSAKLILDRGGKLRLYTTHPDVRIYLPISQQGFDPTRWNR